MIGNDLFLSSKTMLRRKWTRLLHAPSETFRHRMSTTYDTIRPSHFPPTALRPVPTALRSVNHTTPSTLEVVVATPCSVRRALRGCGYELLLTGLCAAVSKTCFFFLLPRAGFWNRNKNRSHSQLAACAGFHHRTTKVENVFWSLDSDPVTAVSCISLEFPRKYIYMCMAFGSGRPDFVVRNALV